MSMCLQRQYYWSFFLYPLSFILEEKTLRKDTTKKRDMQINQQKNRKNIILCVP